MYTTQLFFSATLRIRDEAMPGVKGMKWGSSGLTAAQRSRLEQAVLVDGEGLGVTALHYKMREELGPSAPTREEIAAWKKALPSEQIAQMPREVAGAQNSIAPVIPPAQPLSRVFADSYFLPASYAAQGKGKRGLVYKAGILFVDALTKFIHVEPVAFLEQSRPMSEVALDGYKTFMRKARVASGIADLRPQHLRTDGGSEFKGAFSAWESAQRAAHPMFYAHTITTSGKASGNSLGERHVATVRRLQYAHYRSVARAWDQEGVPNRLRRYDWTEHLPMILDRYNNKLHSTIKCTPMQAIGPGDPTFTVLHDRIAHAAAKVYGKRAVDRTQPTFSEGSETLEVGALVRKSVWKSGQPGKSSWVDSKKASAGTNSWSERVFRVAEVDAGQSAWSNTTYSVAELARDGGEGERLPGKFTRQQLLAIPEETLRYIDEPNAAPDEPTEEDAMNDITTNDPRPAKQGEWRYKTGDTLRFGKEFFATGRIGAFDARRLRRERLGTVKARTRERARGANRGAFLYTIAFEDPVTVVSRLPAHAEGGIDNDEHVELIDLSGEGKRKRKRDHAASKIT